MKIFKNIQLKIVIFTAMKNRYLLQGHVFEMLLSLSRIQIDNKISTASTFVPRVTFPAIRMKHNCVERFLLTL